MKIKAWFNAHPVIMKLLRSFSEGLGYVLMVTIGVYFGLLVFMFVMIEAFPGATDFLLSLI